MSASPDFFKPAGAPAFSPACATQPPLVFADDYDFDCNTPTGNMIAYLKEATTCPPAPRKKPPPRQQQCRKRLFQSEPAHQATAAAKSSSVISLRLDELERLFRPLPPPATTTDKRRRSASSASANKHCTA